MPSIRLIDFWPSEQNCRDCLITEAETADDAVLLAIHQPMRITRRAHGVASEGENKQEEDVLRAFLAPNPPSATLVMPITGGSGVGKSHLIRWMDAHLRLREDRKKRHVVRIPKSASLRGVLDRILENLTGPDYAELRKQLSSAQMPPTLLEAMRRLQANLLVALENNYHEANQRLADQRARPDDRARKTHCSSQALGALLQDPQLAPHFTSDDGDKKGVLTRIADRCLNGSRSNDRGPQNQFFVSDLQPVLTESNTAQVTRTYIGALKQPKKLEEAVGFLNEVIDRAVGDLIDFRGVSLSELFARVRAKLLEDDRELVLLVEDFAVLAGIQGHLLDAMIQEGIRDGKQHLCVMRTAVAVTEGRLPEGVMTRAQYEWRIDHKPFQDEAEAVQSFTDFVGGYLNAARWGAARLRKAFAENPRTAKNATDWVPNFGEEYSDQLRDEDGSALAAFGVSHRLKYSLFPFNADAVRQLARQYLREGDVFKYEPRLLINRILRDTLLQHREAFANGSFPSVGLHRFTENLLALDVSGELRGKTGTLFPRVAVLVYFWAANPRSVGQAAALAPAIYSAFGLTPINWSAKAERVRPDLTPATPTPQATVVARVDPAGTWLSILDGWRDSGHIGQNDAGKLRNLLDEAIHEWLDWDALMLRRVQTRNKRIYLPGAQQSNPPVAEALAVPATEADLKDADVSNVFFKSMRAVVRYHNAKDWSYAEGETDYALYANFIERLAGQAADFYRRVGVELRPEAVTPLVQALLIDARVLNVPGASSNTDADNLAAIFDRRSVPEVVATDDSWANYRLAARAVRTEMQELLLKCVGARLGAGETVYAVDSVALSQAVESLRKQEWQLGEDADLNLFRDQVTIKEHLRELKRITAIAEQRKRVLHEWQKLVTEAFGEDFELSEIAEALRDIVKMANDQGVFRPRDPSHESLRNRIREMGTVKETLQQAIRASAPDTAFGVALSAMAQVDDRTIEKVRSVIDDYRRFLKETEAEVESRLPDSATNLDDAAEKLEKMFGELDALWGQVEEVTDE